MLEHISRVLSCPLILEMRYQSPHGDGSGLEFGREGSIISIVFVLNVITNDKPVQVHTLEHFEKIEPQGEEIIVVHKSKGYRRVAEDVVQVGDQGPVTMIFQHVLCIVNDSVLV